MNPWAADAAIGKSLQSKNEFRYDSSKALAAQKLAADLSMQPKVQRMVLSDKQVDEAQQLLMKVDLAKLP